MALLLNAPPLSEKRGPAATAADRVDLLLSPDQRAQLAQVMQKVFATRHNLEYFLAYLSNGLPLKANVWRPRRESSS